MTVPSAELFETIPTLSTAEVARRLGVEKSRVGRLVQERTLVALPGSAVLRIPEECLVELPGDRQYVTELRQSGTDEPLLTRVTHEVLPHLRGTVLLLEDGKYTPEEVVAWLWSDNDWLPERPIDLLRRGSHKQVNKVAAIAL